VLQDTTRIYFISALVPPRGMAQGMYLPAYFIILVLMQDAFNAKLEHREKLNQITTQYQHMKSQGND
jgi:hypothetical protein